MNKYHGPFWYNRLSVMSFAPNTWGLYCCWQRSLWGVRALYVGRAAGYGVSIRSRLFDHLSMGHWSNVTHFGFIPCATKFQAVNLEAAEIKRLKPKYNQIGK